MHSNIKIKMPQDKGKCTLHVGMHILNGGKNPLVPEICTGTFTISNTQVDVFQTRIEAMKGPKHRIDAFLHVPEPKLQCQYFLEGVLVQTAKEILKILPRDQHPSRPTLLVTTTRSLDENATCVLDKLNGVLKFRMYNREKLNAERSDYFNFPFKPLATCSCACC
jgi:hypothetical protein